MNKFGIFLLLLVSSINSFAYTFTAEVSEVQVYEDRVRVLIKSAGFGTCGDRNGWFGWSTANDRNNNWLSLVLTAKATNTSVTMYDAQGSCSGPVDVVGVEGVFLPAS